MSSHLFSEFILLLMLFGAFLSPGSRSSNSRSLIFCSYSSLPLIFVDLGGQPGRAPKEIGKRQCIYQFLPHFPTSQKILGSPNIFDKSTPMLPLISIFSTRERVLLFNIVAIFFLIDLAYSYAVHIPDNFCSHISRNIYN